MLFSVFVTKEYYLASYLKFCHSGHIQSAMMEAGFVSR